MAAAADRFLLTGGGGFIGSWVVKNLIRRGAAVASLDIDKNDRIMKQVLTKEESSKLKRYTGNVSDRIAVKDAIADMKPTHIIHLAGLQVPVCRVDRIAGAMVNVVGTLNVFEGALVAGGVQKIVCASSAAACGLQDDYDGPVRDEDKHVPRTHYGVYKLCNEGNARIYWDELGVSSVCLRPHTVYGVGREFGMTSGPTKAIKASIMGVPYTIGFNGDTNFNYVLDLAEVFVRCALVPTKGAFRFNIGGEPMHAKDFLATVRELVPEAKDAKIDVVPKPMALPLPYKFDESGLKAYLAESGGVPFTPLRQAVLEIAEHYRHLKKQNLLDDADLKL